LSVLLYKIRWLDGKNGDNKGEAIYVYLPSFEMKESGKSGLRNSMLVSLNL